jgi:hypothetical protein
MSFQRRPNSDRSPESLEARLRALPRPPIPSGLEARILAAIPARPSSNDELPRRGRSASRRWRRLTFWAGASVAAAAACLLAVRFWPEPEDQHTAPILVADPGSTQSPHRATPRPRSDSAWFMANQDLVETEMPTFAWPIQEKSPLMVSTALRPDLFD